MFITYNSVFHIFTVYYLFIVKYWQLRRYYSGCNIILCIIFSLTYKADQKNNIFKHNNDDGVAQKNEKDECNNTVKEDSIKTIDSV